MLDTLLPQEIFGYVIIMVRFAPLVMVMPVLGEQSIPRRIRVTFAFLLSIVIYNAVRDQIIALPEQVFPLASLIATEFMIGLVIGLMARMLMASTHVAGTVIAFQTGLASAQQFDPNQGGQSAIISSFMTIIAITLIVVTDLHHLMIMGLANSYTTFPMGQALPYDDFASIAIYYVVQTFTLGIQLSAPFIIYALLYNLGLGLIARMMPQLQVFFIGMPANVFLGFTLLMLVIGSMMRLFQERFEAYLVQFLGSAMADEDDAQKTEEPTAKKLQDALDKGDVPVSQELKTWFIFLAATILVFSASTYIASELAVNLGAFLGQIHNYSSDDSSLEQPIMQLIWRVFLILLIPFGAFVVAGLIGNISQHKFIFTFEKMKPKLQKISPLSGAKRIFGMRLLVEFGKITAKLLAVSFALFLIVWPERDRLDTLMYVPVAELLSFGQLMALRVFIGVLIVLTVIAALDYSYQKYEHIKKLRMTKQEIKDEQKQVDGDPHVKARLRQIRNERARQRMMASVPDADVVITNPTHYAVALEYKHGNMEVPKLLAKGVDDVALRIREVAEEHGVPIVENPPLARALHAGVEIEEEVPPEHYQAVAQVIGYIMKLEKAGISKKKRTEEIEH